MINYGSLRSRGVAWLNMPPCQGGERGFKSRRDRRIESEFHSLFFINQLLYKISPSKSNKNPRNIIHPKVLLNHVSIFSERKINQTNIKKMKGFQC